ncbi:glucosaminidase domain-containing protein [Pelagibius sp.]|uniref:glucosaminidase domain-containing protein n=1 Tax=Pelagibius sp. TaxID=1931238 RepID=UPI003B50714D
MVARSLYPLLQHWRRWQPTVQRACIRANRSLLGRTTVLSGVFGVCLVLGLWQGAQPLPPSAWQELGLLSQGPVLRRLPPRDANDLAAYFDSTGYTLSRLHSGAPVPRLAVARLPRDMDELSDSDRRKALFLRSLLPLVLQANAEIARIRTQVVAALDAKAAGRLGATDALWLEQVAEWYGAAPGDAADLLSRIDQVPPSLALAQAAQESGWGRSRFARDANALFGQRVWSDHQPGLAPKDVADASFRVRAFPDLMTGVRSYLHNLNSHRAYQRFRELRAKSRAGGQRADAIDLAGSLSQYSEEGADYVAALRRLISRNDLRALDGLRLELLTRS